MKGSLLMILALCLVIVPCASDANIELNKGWNFVAVPLLNPDYHYPGYQVYSVFSNVDTAGHSLWRYNAATISWDKLYPDSTISPLDGIWIYSNNSMSVTVQGDNSVAPAPKQLYPGWNAIGFAGVETTAGQAFYSLRGTWQIAMSYSGLFQQYNPTIFDSEPTRNILTEPGSGYWIYLNSPGLYYLAPTTQPVITPVLTILPTTVPTSSPTSTSFPTTGPTTGPTAMPSPTTVLTTVPTTGPTITPSPTPTGHQPGATVSSSEVFGQNFLWYQYLLTINSNGTSMQADLKTEISSDTYSETPAIHYKNTMVMLGQDMTIITDIYYDTTLDTILGGTMTYIISGQTTTTDISPGQLKKSGEGTNFQKETILTYVGIETVSVPAGTFVADKYTAPTDDGTGTYWVARGVPVPVKYYITSLQNGDTTAELEGWG
jgi:hypothetical protein